MAAMIARGSHPFSLFNTRVRGRGRRMQ